MRSPSNGEGLSNIQHNIRHNTHKVSYLIHYNTLLQNATDIITICNSYFITVRGRSLLQIASGFLSQNVTVLLQNTTI